MHINSKIIHVSQTICLNTEYYKLKLGRVTLAAVYKDDLSNKITLNLSRKKSETFLLEGTPSIAKKSLHINIWVSMRCSSHRSTDKFILVEIGRVIFRNGPYFASISSQTHIFHRLLLFSAEGCFDPPSYLHALRSKLLLFCTWHFSSETSICMLYYFAKTTAV